MRPGSPELVLTVNGGSTAGTVWASPTGEAWTRATIDPAIINAPESTEFGWLMPGYLTAAISGDGRSWESMDLPPISGESSLVHHNGLLFLGPEQSGASFVTWVGRMVTT